MANSKLSALTAITSAADTDELYVANTGTSKKITWANIKATLKTYLDTLYLSVTGGTLAGGTVTASTPVLSVTQTWNDAAVTFTAISVDVTNTASNSSSKVVDLKVGGSTVFSADRSGRIDATNAYFGNYLSVTNTAALGYVTLKNGRLDFGTGSDTYLYKDAANTIAQRNGTAAQTKRLYGTYTDASNYRRVAIAMTTAGVASIAPEGAGTGASGNVLHISGLPTANPGPGILWNDAGTVKVGT